ncbi:MAG: tetratricopeptide repeat protein [Myxococcota bacterium]|nr:tetratricopeptide repeat protein [Myxococcota bacterium]
MTTEHPVELAVAFLLLLASLALPRSVSAQAYSQEQLETTVAIPDPVKLTIDFAAIAEATVAEQEGDVEGALAILDAAIERGPDDGTLIAARGAVLLQAGDPDGARAEFTRAVAANSDDPSGFAGLCAMAVLEGAGMRIEDSCTAARSRNLQDPIYAEIAMATEMMEGRLSDVVVGTLDTLAVANPYVPAIRLLSLEANIEAGNTSMARSDLRLLWQVFAPPGGVTPRILDRIAAFKLADIVGADMPCALAWAEIRIGRLEGNDTAASYLEKVATCRPEGESVREQRLAQLNREGMEARTTGDHATAIARFRAAMDIRDDDPVLLNNLAHTAFEGGDPATAELALRALLALTPDDAEVRRNLGICLMALGREDEARPYLEGEVSSDR